jgi:hypothetical protein
MISLNKLLRISPQLIIVLAIILGGCSKEPEKKKYIARVNDSYLIEEDLSYIDSLLKYGFSRNEIVKNWVEKELLYQEAVKLGVTNEEKFNRTINNSRRELAFSFLINKYFTENLKKPNKTELQEFYDRHKNEFKADENIYVLNSASFKDENAAIKFRTKLVKGIWEKEMESHLDDTSLINHSNRSVLSKAEIYPLKLLNLIEELNPGEVSIVLEENETKYSVVQLVQTFRSGTAPPIELIADQVEAKYSAEKREEIFNDYLKKLYSDNQIEIKEN